MGVGWSRLGQEEGLQMSVSHFYNSNHICLEANLGYGTASSPRAGRVILTPDFKSQEVWGFVCLSVRVGVISQSQVLNLCASRAC